MNDFGHNLWHSTGVIINLCLFLISLHYYIKVIGSRLSIPLFFDFMTLNQITCCFFFNSSLIKSFSVLCAISKGAMVILRFSLCLSLFLLCCSEVGKLLQVQNGTPPSTNYNGVDAVHACNILQQLKALYDEAQLTDIVVEVDHGKTFSCHRNVLAAISPYFR